MSDTQFRIYEGARKQERELEKKRPKAEINELFEEKSSTYRIFSRLFCNYIIPERPIPERRKKKKEGKAEQEEEEKEGASEFAQVIKEGLRIENKQDVEDEREGEIEGDEVLEILGG